MGPLAHNAWNGEAAVIIGGGPSLDLIQIRAIGVARAGNFIKVIAINDAVYPAWFADAAYACDAKWWRFHGPLPAFSGARYSLEETGLDGVTQLQNTGTLGFDPEPFCIRSGGNGGYQSICLAAHLGVKRVILVGYDMSGDNGEHWFGLHPDKLRMRPPKMMTRIAAFDELNGEMMAIGVDVMNATPGSALSSFRRVDLATALKEEAIRHDQ